MSSRFTALVKKHEANVRGEGKTVRVVFKYLSRSPIVKGGGGRNITSPLNDLTVILQLGVSFIVKKVPNVGHWSRMAAVKVYEFDV